ncbi:MAG: tetratricopeptide repeat protein [Acidobacteria bacterium]|nr:tetratricopeptide repeat protein [Acidobacteriota bacterium]MDA1234851.1 tetratricopeptide repeat protein [Acidobacteriota bacterium]
MSAKKQQSPPKKPAGKASSAGLLRSAPWLFALLVIAMGVAAYWPATAGGYVLDDYDLLEPGAPIRASSFRSLVGPERPIVTMSYLANSRLGGLNPSGFHFTNILIHCLNALILWRLLIALLAAGKIPERIAANRELFVYGIPLLFLLSPIQTESVAYISSRTELLAVLFFLLGLWGFIGYRERRPWAAAAIVLICLAFSVLSKQDKLVLPAVVLAMDYLILSGCDWRGLRKSWPLYGTLAAGVAAGAVLVIRPILFVQSAGFRLDWKTYLFTQFRMYFRYLGQLLWPFHLNLDPDIVPSHSLIEQGSWLALLLLAAIAAATLRWHRKAPIVAFGAVLFFIALAPTTSFFPLLDFAAERRLYLPSIGFFVAILAALSFLRLSQRSVLRVGLAAVLIVYGVATFQRSQVWADELALWQDTVEKSPGKSRPWGWLGRVHDGRGQQQLAEQAWIRAEQVVRPGSFEQAALLGNLGLAEARKQNYQKAVDYYQRAFEIRAYRPTLRAQLAVAFMRLGRTDEGWQEFEKAFRNTTGSYEVLILRAQELYLVGRYAEAAQDYRMALALLPDSVEAQRNLEVAQAAARKAGQP